MTQPKLMAGLAAVLIGSAGLVAAAQPDGTGKDKAMERLQRAATEHVRILTELAERLPEQARADLTPAIEAAGSGLARAREAAAPAAPEPVMAQETAETPEGTPDETPEETPDETPGDGDTPPVTGLANAREHVAAALEKSVSVLQEVMVKVPANAAMKIEAALARIQQHRMETLANLDRVAALEHPVKPERPERAARPERVERPERVARPEKPERPERPRP